MYSERVEPNPVDVPLPEWMEGTATKATGRGVFVLVVSGRCSCGNSKYHIAPDWKVPAEWGGGYMTDQCLECLGTIEYSGEWLRVDRAVDDHSELRPEDGDGS